MQEILISDIIRTRTDAALHVHNCKCIKAKMLPLATRPGVYMMMTPMALVISGMFLSTHEGQQKFNVPVQQG